MTRRLSATAAALILLAGCSKSPSPAPAEPSASPTSVTASASPQASPAPSAAQSPNPSAPASAAPSPNPSAPASAAPVSGPPRLQRIGIFDQPTYVVSPPGDRRLFVVEKAGKIVIAGTTRTFLDITNSVSSGGERGLLSMAFAPDYSSSGLVYVSYTNTAGDSRIDEYHVSSDPDRLDPASKRQILALAQPYPNHNGGLIRFDSTGMMIAGYGDGGGAGDPGNRAQNLSVLLGKFLRIDPRKPSGGNQYSIPADNPFVGRSGVRPEIWAYGLRNPWRWSFDTNNDLYVGDVGQNTREEIDYVPPAAQPGANYGWPKYEGTGTFKNVKIDESRLVRPILDYPTANGNCAVTGGGIYRGSVEQLKGTYLYGDFCGGVIKGFRVQDGKATDIKTFVNLKVPSLASFGEDSAGEMYAASLEGPVYRISGG